jgi:hypothetical protein
VAVVRLATAEELLGDWCDPQVFVWERKDRVGGQGALSVDARVPQWYRDGVMVLS